MAEGHVFITGAAGYVGRNLLRHFVARGHAVTGLVRSPEAADRIASWGARPVLGDMLTAELAPLMSGADRLIHAAANVDHTTGSAAASVNPDGTRRVLEAANAAGVEKAIHISTDSVLQDGRPLRNVDETAPYPDRPAGHIQPGRLRRRGSPGTPPLKASMLSSCARAWCGAGMTRQRFPCWSRP